MKTRIIGTGSALPETIVTNDALSEVVDTNDEWIRSRTGIGTRRIAKTETTDQLAAAAAAKALENAATAAEEIELILVASSSAENVFPNIASMVQEQLHAVNAVCYDISAACSGFLAALHTADAFIRAGIYKKAIVVGAEKMSKLLDWKDRSTCVLFGDGAGAVVVAADTETGIAHTVFCSDGAKGDVLTCRSDGNISMDGQAVFKFAVKKVPEAIEILLQQCGKQNSDIKYYILHQANVRIIQSVARRLQIDESKFPMNLEQYGNTSAASIPILLDECNRRGDFCKGDQLVLSGFGAGLSWGAMLLAW